MRRSILYPPLLSTKLTECLVCLLQLYQIVQCLHDRLEIKSQYITNRLNHQVHGTFISDEDWPLPFRATFLDGLPVNQRLKGLQNQ